MLSTSLQLGRQGLTVSAQSAWGSVPGLKNLPVGLILPRGLPMFQYHQTEDQAFGIQLWGTLQIQVIERTQRYRSQGHTPEKSPTLRFAAFTYRCPDIFFVF